jgi:hypothetical protein
LAQLWRLLLVSLESLVGTDQAPALARTLAIAGLTGHSARAGGLEIHRLGEDVVVTGPGLAEAAAHPQCASIEGPRPRSSARAPRLQSRKTTCLSARD